jgi:hypothetical protein
MVMQRMEGITDAWKHSPELGMEGMLSLKWLRHHCALELLWF